jgi:hypothetical protein
MPIARVLGRFQMHVIHPRLVGSLLVLEAQMDLLRMTYSAVVSVPFSPPIC